MSITMQCSDCEHEWDERASKAGRSVECPECGVKNRVTREKRRPSRPSASSTSNLPRTMLIGGSIFLVGVVSMIGLRMAQIRSVITEDPSPPIVDGTPSESTDGVEISEDNDSIVIPDESAVETVDTGSNVPVESVANTKVLEPSPAPTVTTETGITSAINTDRGRELMAAMNEVGLKVDGFAADVRGAVSQVVKDSVSGAIEQCQLSIRAPVEEPIMYVALQMKGEKLLISAKLIAVDQQEKVRVWERSGAVSELTEKAASTGIIPTGLARDIASFFKSLRLEFNEARRQFAS